MIDVVTTGAGGPEHNRWRCWDAVEPILRWTLRVPLPDEGPASGDGRRRLVADISAILDETGLVRVQSVDVAGAPRFSADEGRSWAEVASQGSAAEVTGAGSGELFPFAAALLDGEGRVTLESRVTVSDPSGAATTVRASDAGALLQALEPDLDEAYRRRFAASHPFVGVWSQAGGGFVEVTVGFWSDIFQAGGPGAEDNQERADEAARLLTALAEARGGTFTVDG